MFEFSPGIFATVAGEIKGARSPFPDERPAGAGFKPLDKGILLLTALFWTFDPKVFTTLVPEGARSPLWITSKTDAELGVWVNRGSEPTRAPY